MIAQCLGSCHGAAATKSLMKAPVQRVPGRIAPPEVTVDGIGGEERRSRCDKTGSNNSTFEPLADRAGRGIPRCGALGEVHLRRQVKTEETA